MKKKILIILACLVAVAGVFCGIYWPESEINNTISDVQNQLVEQIQNEEKAEKQNIIITDETQEIIEDTIEAVEKGEDISTKEVIESSEEEEKEITDEGALEIDATVEQENISYDGSNTGNGLSLLGAYQGLTYYSQADSRWANVLYTSTGNSTQTMKSSACGPTSAAIIVSSSKGAILPTTMANLAVANGYRTANNGTAWSAFPFVADYFDFNEYYYTTSVNTALSYLRQDKDNDGNSDYYVIVSCGSGLFTTGGHYIVLVADDGNKITVYDPYLYNGKFNTASRRNAKVVVSGNSAYVTESAFKTYANAKCFFVYSNDKGTGTEISQFTEGQKVLINEKIAVCWKGSDKSIVDNGLNQFWISNSCIKDDKIYAVGTICYVEGSNYIVEILGDQFWTNSASISANINESSTGKYTTTANLNIRAGAGTNYSVKGVYKKGTSIKIIEIKNNWARTEKGWVSMSYLK